MTILEQKMILHITSLLLCVMTGRNNAHAFSIVILQTEEVVREINSNRIRGFHTVEIKLYIDKLHYLLLICSSPPADLKEELSVASMTEFTLCSLDSVDDHSPD